MRRVVAAIAAFFTLIGGFTPIAMASLEPMRASHACCIRAHHKHECHEMEGDAPAAEQPEPSDAHLQADHSCCTVCVAPALISHPASHAREVVVVMPAPEHRYAQEFYPFDAPEASVPAQSERAPPARKARHFEAIHNLIAFVRQHI
jgi:hypothetical protein